MQDEFQKLSAIMNNKMGGENGQPPMTYRPLFDAGINPAALQKIKLGTSGQDLLSVYEGMYGQLGGNQSANLLKNMLTTHEGVIKPIKSDPESLSGMISQYGGGANPSSMGQEQWKNNLASGEVDSLRGGGSTRDAYRADQLKGLLDSSIANGPDYILDLSKPIGSMDKPNTPYYLKGDNAMPLQDNSGSTTIVPNPGSIALAQKRAEQNKDLAAMQAQDRLGAPQDMTPEQLSARQAQMANLKATTDVAPIEGNATALPVNPSAPQDINLNTALRTPRAAQTATAAPSGYQYKDPNYPELGVTPIPGTKAAEDKAKQAAESGLDVSQTANAGKAALTHEGYDTVLTVKDMIANPDGTLNKGLVYQMNPSSAPGLSGFTKSIFGAAEPVPHTEGAVANTMLRRIAEAQLRSISPRAPTQQAIESKLHEIMPRVTDTPEQALARLEGPLNQLGPALKTIDPNNELGAQASRFSPEQQTMLRSLSAEDYDRTVTKALQKAKDNKLPAYEINKLKREMQYVRASKGKFSLPQSAGLAGGDVGGL